MIETPANSRENKDTSSAPTKWIATLLAMMCVLTASDLGAQTGERSTAWKDGVFHLERQGIVERSNIILQKPNELSLQAMPLGNGRLGLAVWDADGLTAQLNRGDTFPLRLSPGQVLVPGLSRLTHAHDYAGQLNLYNGELEQRGAGMTVTTYVMEGLDVMAIDVTGADPDTRQTAEIRLWSPRHPTVISKGKLGIVAETWLDDKEAGASGETFGSLAALTADALEVQAERSGPLSVKVSFRPRPDGTFRILVGAPAWRGGDAATAASKLMTGAMKLSPEEHRIWWHEFWQRAGLMKLSSPDHAAEYLENLRVIDLFTAAAESRDHLPGSQAGVGDLFSSIRDDHKWGPSAYWHWNLRMQVSANLGAGLFDLNQSYFTLYRENLKNMQDWTKLHMAGRDGICIPETMRFNGRGYENETWIPEPAINCGDAASSKPYYNARTISTGAEVSFWIWQQYLFTDDLGFLAKNYPVMRETAKFLLAYSTHSADGKLHTFPSNAHESKWDVHDPTTDIAAMRSVFPVIVKAATLLKLDRNLVERLEKEIPLLPPLPRVSLSSPNVLVPQDADRRDTVIAASHDPAAKTHNVENIGLEPVWPYGIIGDDGDLHELAIRTYRDRPNKNEADWSADPVQAARLGMADEFRSSLLSLTEHYQSTPSGLANFVGSEFYVEQIGVLADAVQTALVQDYDGLVRILPAWPKDWSADATVSIQHGSKVDLQVLKGELNTLGIEAGSSTQLRLRNPWPGKRIEVVDARSAGVIYHANAATVAEFPVRKGRSYLVRQPDSGILPFAAVRGVAASAPKTYGSRSIGVRSN